MRMTAKLCYIGEIVCMKPRNEQKHGVEGTEMQLGWNVCLWMPCA